MKKLIAILALVAATAGVFVVYEVQKRKEFLSMSAVEVVEILTRKSMPEAIDRFHRDLGRYPTSMEGLAVLLQAPAGEDGGRWRGPYVAENELPRDPWGRQYQYLCPGIRNPQSYDLWSLGKDGTASDDDAGNWTK